MITIHHLGQSRSDRIIWLCEELGLEYKLVVHDRDPETMRAPQALWEINPLGKSPVIEDGDQVVFESGAIIEYLVERHGAGKLRPAKGSPAEVKYWHWMHCAESTLMLPIMINILTGAMGIESDIVPLFVDAERGNFFGYIDAELAGHDYIAGDEFTAADIMLGYTLAMANTSPLDENFQATEAAGGSVFEPYANIQQYLARLHARPAYLRAVERG